MSKRNRLRNAVQSLERFFEDTERKMRREGLKQPRLSKNGGGNGFGLSVFGHKKDTNDKDEDREQDRWLTW